MRYNLIYKKGKKEIGRVSVDHTPPVPRVGEKLCLDGKGYTVKSVKYIIFSKNKSREDTTDVMILCSEDPEGDDAVQSDCTG